MIAGIETKRERQRKWRLNRYHNDPEFRAKQIEYSKKYQERMWYTSKEFRMKKNIQRKNPTGLGIGRPRIQNADY